MKAKKPRIILYPYKMASASIKALKEELVKRGHKVMRVKKNGSYKPRPTDFIVNWGCAADNQMWPEWEVMPILPTLPLLISKGLNDYNAVGTARNKLFTFNALEEAGVSIPEYTCILEEAKAWFEAGFIVFGRHSLVGQGGADIEIFSQEDGHGHIWDNMPMYTKYIKKKSEYRVHVFGTEVIDVQQKKKKQGWDGERDTRIRNLVNGYVFCRMGIQPPKDVMLEAVRAVVAVGLDFGAVDVIWNENYKKAYVLEINTAPGLEGTTVTKYADSIEKEFKRRLGL